MLTWLQNWLRREPDRNDDAALLRQLSADVDRDPTVFPVEDLRPVLVPTAIFEIGWGIGPYHHFPELPVSLTWSFLRPQQTMMYLATRAVAAFEAKRIDWRAAAHAALAREFDGHPWTHAFNNERGELEAVAFMHEDGLGPSRLILYRKLIQRFPSGFVFFVPERSCALLMSANAGAKVRSSVERAVHGCFSAADVPMSESGYDHTLLKEALDRAGECA